MEKKKKKEKNVKIAEIEAILFTTGEPIKREQLQKFFKLTKVELNIIINSLSDRYQQKDVGLQIIEKGGKIQLVSKSEVSQVVAKFLGITLNEELSRVTLETLAVIAYRGPVTRAQIEHIRGVNSSFALRTLSLRGIVERRENPLDSRSYLYEISFEFLKSLGLKKIGDLKDYKKLKEKLPLEEETESRDSTSTEKIVE
jgi:segregation and condensation protein B